ncbi:DUF1223 domain-containing protein [Actibacterium sp. XHP0104]|uniref:DUF1223 domain-containing protein n=1 Tax=Actibacterium sp. XHP0104 TaxID=2984335 RepID=UPI0021E84E78|nr:DUF1223 domain-containing protein [Actibacterium sp. XHP0104]MCV2880917.1 DUF1223 domain-containing protein [Actibacterium sp. XHP0104]
MTLFARARYILSASFLAGGLALGAVPVMAADVSNPVVVELYTSQGCSSCPPADALLNDLAARDDVIALSLHVDYWDYIGWKDVFADPAYTKRQKAYARAVGSRTVYTPQMIIAGDEHVVGVRPMEVIELIQQHKARPGSVAMSLRREGGKVVVSARALRPLRGEAVLQLVSYEPQAVVEITRGENAGRTIRYSNIVRSWTPVARWTGEDALNMSFDVPADQPIVAILQEKGPGAILAAARLR